MNWKIRIPRPLLSATCLGLLLPFITLFGSSHASQSGIENTRHTLQSGTWLQVTATPTISAESPSAFEITLAQLGYDEKVLISPYDTADYTLRLPEGWELRRGSLLDLDVSYTFNRTDISGVQTQPSFLGNIVITVDGETQLVFPIKESKLEHTHLRLTLPVALLNNPERSLHRIQVILDANFICEIPHEARLIVYPTSFFSLAYEQFPINADLARYPRPFYQQSFKPDEVQFVLPAAPTETELNGAVAVAARLGNLSGSNLVISGTTDMDLINHWAAGETLQKHLILIGKPESSQAILKLNQLGILPVSLRERQLSLASEGPASVAPGDILTYTLTMTNTGQDELSSLTLVDMLPTYAQVVTCSPSCSKTEEGEVGWSTSSLGVGETLNYILVLRLSEVITDSVVDNTITLLDANSTPMNVNTLTTTVSSVPMPESGPSLSISTADGYFFRQGDRGVPESDGVVQEITSPWDQSKAILVITGLDDEAVLKASKAMSFESHFPGMIGTWALVREVLSLPTFSPESQASDLTFADLGYEDRVTRGITQRAYYYFDIPLGWRLTDAAYLDLRFSHSQLIDYGSSSLTVLLNSKPIATVALSDETSLAGKLQVKLPAPLAHPGQKNEISIQVGMHPLEECTKVDMWSMISSESLLHLDHSLQDTQTLDLNLYPTPFNRRPDLSDVLFVLPAMPQSSEWENALQLAAALGSAANGPKLLPAVNLGEVPPEADPGDYHLIAIGRPSRNSMIQQVNARLPQPFLPGSDQIEQRLDEVILRLPPDVSLGYVQLIPSPWNERRALLAVTGTSDEGVTWATWSLVRSGLLSQLEGNLALIRDREIRALDTRKLTRSGLNAVVSTAVPELTPIATVITPTVTTTGPAAVVAMSATRPTGESQPSWLIPLVILTVLTVVIIFAIAIWQALRRRNADRL